MVFGDSTTITGGGGAGGGEGGIDMTSLDQSSKSRTTIEYRDPKLQVLGLVHSFMMSSPSRDEIEHSISCTILPNDS
jgi:hypothetical protein